MRKFESIGYKNEDPTVPVVFGYFQEQENGFFTFISSDNQNIMEDIDLDTKAIYLTEIS